MKKSRVIGGIAGATVLGAALVAGVYLCNSGYSFSSNSGSVNGPPPLENILGLNPVVNRKNTKKEVLEDKAGHGSDKKVVERGREYEFPKKYAQSLEIEKAYGDSGKPVFYDRNGNPMSNKGAVSGLLKLYDSLDPQRTSFPYEVFDVEDGVYIRKDGVKESELEAATHLINLCSQFKTM